MFGKDSFQLELPPSRGEHAEASSWHLKICVNLHC